MKSRLPIWMDREKVYTDWGTVWMKAEGEFVLRLKAQLFCIFIRIRRMCPCECLFLCFSSTYEFFFLLFSFICPWPWLTQVQTLLPVSSRTKWKCTITIPQQRLQKTQNSGAAIDTFIMQSECTNSRFHHLAHQQLFPMNYLLAALLLACPLFLMW